MSANLDTKLDELQEAIATEMQQLKDAITAGAQGQDAIAQVERATARVQAAIDALKSDDATPA